MKYFNIARSETGSSNDGATFLGTVATMLDEEAARRKIDERWKAFVDGDIGDHTEFVEFLCENHEFHIARTMLPVKSSHIVC